VSDEFAISTERLDAGRGLVILRGEVDIYPAPRLKEQLSALLDDGRIRVRAVTVWETERACVRFSKEG
jgi:anti-anti-sigma regulatory factor